MVVLGLVVAGAEAQDDVDDLREQREETRRDAAEVAAEIDALNAEDQDLVEALAAIDAHIALQEEKVDSARVAIEEAARAARAARREAEALGVEIDGVRARLRERAVEAYVGPRSGQFEEFDNADLMESALRRSFLDEIVGDEYELVDQLRPKVAAQSDAARLADELVAEVAREEAELEARLAELEVAREEADRLRLEVQDRISEWEALGDELAAADAAIAEEIRRLEAEAARLAAEAEAEARRIAEEEAARRAAEEAAAAEAAEAADDEADPTEAADEEEAAAEPTTDAEAPGDFTITHRPVPGVITSPYGERVHPIFGRVRTHYGIDFDGDTGDPIVAAAGGTVLSAGWRTGYGNTVVISHGSGFTTVYAHQTDVAVSAGDVVAGGELIGWVGSTGWSTGPHLHFEVRVEGVAVDPDPYLP